MRNTLRGWSTLHRRTLILALLSLSSTGFGRDPKPVQNQPIVVAEDFAPVARKAIRHLKNAYEIFNHLRDSLEKIQAGETPKAKSQSLDAISERLRATAVELAQQPLPGDFDPSLYRVTADELANCASRPAALDKLRRYLEELRAAEDRRALDLQTLSEMLNTAKKSDEALLVLIEAHKQVLLHGELTWAPAFSQFFALNWLDLEQSVRPSLASLISSISARQRKLRQAQRAAALPISNLTGNLADLEKLACLDGRWLSTDSAGRFTLEISGSRVLWTERAKDGQRFTRIATMTHVAEGFRIERANDDAALRFLGFQPSLRAQIVERSPEASFMIIRASGDSIESQWHGLMAIKNTKAKLERLIQPSQASPKVYRFRKSDE